MPKVNLKWTELPQLPSGPGQQKQNGVAGPFAGVHNGVLIVAGGANFPDAPPWERGKKVWWDDVFVLEKTDEGRYQWITDKSFKLPRLSAYGVSVSTPDGIVCIGGCDANKCYDTVYLLKWDPVTRETSIEEVPSLPRPLAFMTGALVGHTIYVSGGQEDIKSGLATKNFFALDLSKKSDPNNFRWKELDPWLGPARITNLAAAQSDGATECFYMFSGRNPVPGKPTKMLSDTYKYNPKMEKWEKLADITPNGEKPRCVMAGTAMDFGRDQVLIFGGDNGKISLRLEQLDRRIVQTADKSRAHLTKNKQATILQNHPGFSRDILAYDTVTDTWTKSGRLPTTSHVMTSAVKWDGTIVIPSGEFTPGVRTPRVWKANPAPLLPRKPSASNFAGVPRL